MGNSWMIHAMKGQRNETRGSDEAVQDIENNFLPHIEQDFQRIFSNGVSKRGFRILKRVAS